MEKYINFVCNDQHFALSINQVEKILLFQQPARIPDTLDYVAGYYSYNEAPLPLIDMKKRLFEEKTVPDDQTKIMVVHWQGDKLGLIVEKITHVKEFQNDSENKDIEENSQISYLLETFHDQDGIILHIDIDKLFSEEGVKELHTLMRK
ncbi:Chemotaxis protein CheW [Jeotgalibaca dankookensis]|uniref:Chemotaxis protein CheW n=1 Tax=Jeotgalibaca dankookensis TaxID=708126 RepID=A0A1S6IRJ5_9LACT|nr:chemotaxis protein CheW [Jeotgalibaca dankookensis]AQS54172.1 Chemotaxis protein CheW [Jeotgalibaca dankookensis]